MNLYVDRFSRAQSGFQEPILSQFFYIIVEKYSSLFTSLSLKCPPLCNPMVHIFQTEDSFLVENILSIDTLHLNQPKQLQSAQLSKKIDVFGKLQHVDVLVFL